MIVYFKLFILADIIHFSAQTPTLFAFYSPFQQKCVERCITLKCAKEKIKSLVERIEPLAYNRTKWSCHDECRYKSMRETLDGFHESNQHDRLFLHTKIPSANRIQNPVSRLAASNDLPWSVLHILLPRLTGIKKPTSFVLSLINIYINVVMILKFRKDVEPDSPFFSMWHVYFLISTLSWLSSSIYYAFNYNRIEFMVGSVVYPLTAATVLCTFMRLLHNRPLFLRFIFVFIFFMLENLHYTHMDLQIFTFIYTKKQIPFIPYRNLGSYSAVIWLIWASYHRDHLPHFWKCVAFVSICETMVLVELVESSPTDDIDSVWLLSSPPLTLLFYSYIIDDCIYLRNAHVDIIK